MAIPGATAPPPRRYVRWLAFALVAPLIMGAVTLAIGLSARPFLHRLASAGGAATPGGPELRVSPSAGSDDVPVEWTATGLPVDTPVTVEVSMPDRSGDTWRTSATYDSGPSGVVSAHDAPTGGDYSGVDPMALFSLVRPDNPPEADPTDPYDAGDWFDGGGRWTATMTVSVGGSTVASADVERDWAPDIDGKNLTVAKDGILGEYVFPYDGATKPPVLVIGDPRQFDGPLAEHLAQNGHPTLAVTYAGAPGLPARARSLPIEYFAKALAWLRAQPGVQSGRVVVLGEDAGTEAAQLLAIAHPADVHGLVLANPSVRASAADDRGAAGLWTIGGKAVPYADPAHPGSTDASSILRTDQANAFVLTVCGILDTIDLGCTGAKQLAGLLQDAHYAQPVAAVEAATIGASVETLVPYQPHTHAWGGGTLAAESVELPKVWAKVLHAIDNDGQVV